MLEYVKQEIRLFQVTINDIYLAICQRKVWFIGLQIRDSEDVIKYKDLKSGQSVLVFAKYLAAMIKCKTTNSYTEMLE